MYEDIDFSEEVDEEASFNQTEDNSHISAMFDAIQSDKINIFLVKLGLCVICMVDIERGNAHLVPCAPPSSLSSVPISG